MNSRERPTDRFRLEVTRNHCKLSFLPKPVGPTHLEIYTFITHTWETQTDSEKS